MLMLKPSSLGDIDGQANQVFRLTFRPAQNPRSLSQPQNTSVGGLGAEFTTVTPALLNSLVIGIENCSAIGGIDSLRPEIRVVEPMIGGIAKDLFRRVRYEQKLHGRNIDSPDNRVEALEQFHSFGGRRLRLGLDFLHRLGFSSGLGGLFHMSGLFYWGGRLSLSGRFTLSGRFRCRHSYWRYRRGR